MEPQKAVRVHSHGTATGSTLPRHYYQLALRVRSDLPVHNSTPLLSQERGHVRNQSTMRVTAVTVD